MNDPHNKNQKHIKRLKLIQSIILGIVCFCVIAQIVTLIVTLSDYAFLFMIPIIGGSIAGILIGQKILNLTAFGYVQAIVDFYKAFYDSI